VEFGSKPILLGSFQQGINLLPLMIDEIAVPDSCYSELNWV